jgi:hypothetical protein
MVGGDAREKARALRQHQPGRPADAAEAGASCKLEVADTISAGRNCKRRTVARGLVKGALEDAGLVIGGAGAQSEMGRIDAERRGKRAGRRGARRLRGYDRDQWSGGQCQQGTAMKRHAKSPSET